MTRLLFLLKKINMIRENSSQPLDSQSFTLIDTFFYLSLIAIKPIKLHLKPMFSPLLRRFQILDLNQHSHHQKK